MTRTPERLELVAQSQCGSILNLRTNSTLGTVLKPGYFQAKWPDANLRKGDRLNIVASYDSDEPQFATLAVVRAGKKGDCTLVQLRGGTL